MPLITGLGALQRASFGLEARDVLGGRAQPRVAKSGVVEAAEGVDSTRPAVRRRVIGVGVADEAGEKEWLHHHRHHLDGITRYLYCASDAFELNLNQFLTAAQTLRPLLDAAALSSYLLATWRSL